MTNKAPSAPAENRSPKGTGEQKSAPKTEGREVKSSNPDREGQQGNSKLNTTNQGYQQDR